METTLLEVAGRSCAIYFVLFLALRFLGKREVSQFSTFDLILLLILANAVQNAMVGSNNSLAGGITAGLTLLGINFLLGKLLSSRPRLRHWLEGKPSILVRHGKVEWRTLRMENIDSEALMAALRQHGLQRVKDVELAVLELDGSVSVVGPGGKAVRRRKSGGKPNLFKEHGDA
jgi:uncharacterized membrane protein YcaP (DUF421 family)